MSTDARPTRRDVAAVAIGLALGFGLGTAAGLALDELIVVGIALAIGFTVGAVIVNHASDYESDHWRGLYSSAADQAAGLQLDLARTEGDRVNAERALLAAEMEARNLRSAAEVLSRQLDAERAKHTP